MSASTITEIRSSSTATMTFVLPLALAQSVRRAVETGAFASPSELASAAIASELKSWKEAEVARAMRDAASDPLFMADLEESMRDLSPLDADINGLSILYNEEGVQGELA